MSSLNKVIVDRFLRYFFTSDNPGYVALTSADGNQLAVEPDGSINANVNIDSVTATDVTIRDGANASQKLSVDADGSAAVKLTGSNISEKRDALLVRSTDYAGKITGTVYDVPHRAFRASATTFGTPASFSSEFIQARYDNISYRDGSVTDMTTGVASVGFYAQIMFEWDILAEIKKTLGIQSNVSVADVIGALKGLRGGVVGQANGWDGSANTKSMVIKVRNITTSAWTTLVTSTNTALDFVAFTLSSFTDYIDSNGKLYILIHSTYPNDNQSGRGSAVEVDYIKMDLVISGALLNSVEKPRSFQFNYPNRTLASNEEQFIYETYADATIEGLTWGSNDPNGELVIYAYKNSVAVKIGEISRDGTSLITFKGADIATHGTATFEIIEYDAVNNYYKFGLRNVRFSGGFRLAVKNSGVTASIKVGVFGWGRVN